MHARHAAECCVFTSLKVESDVSDIDRTVHPRMQRAPTSAVTAETEKRSVPATPYLKHIIVSRYNKLAVPSVFYITPIAQDEAADRAEKPNRAKPVIFSLPP